MTEPPLSDDEVRRLRAILTQDDRVAWLWASVRKWVAGAALLVAGLVAFRKDVIDLFAWIFRGSS